LDDGCLCHLVFTESFSLCYYAADYPQGNGQPEMDSDFLPAANNYWDLSMCRSSWVLLFVWFGLIFWKKCAILST
jgi:hypothetical protein